MYKTTISLWGHDIIGQKVCNEDMTKVLDVRELAHVRFEITFGNDSYFYTPKELWLLLEHRHQRDMDAYCKPKHTILEHSHCPQCGNVITKA